MNKPGQKCAQILELAQFRAQRTARVLAERDVILEREAGARASSQRSQPADDAPAYLATGAVTMEQLLDEMRRHQHPPAC